MRKAIILLILAILLINGCEKQVQKEIPVEEIPVQEITTPEGPAEEELEQEPAPIVEEEVPPGEVEPEPPKFISDMVCVNGIFNFTMTNTGDVDLTIKKVPIHIKAKLFFPECGVDVLAPGNSTRCSQTYYSNIVGEAPVKIQAKIGNKLETYIENVMC